MNGDDGYGYSDGGDRGEFPSETMSVGHAISGGVLYFEPQGQVFIRSPLHLLHLIWVLIRRADVLQGRAEGPGFEFRLEVSGNRCSVGKSRLVVREIGV